MARTQRNIHHLVYHSARAKQPVYCGASFEEAQASAAVLRRPVISLLVSGTRSFDLESDVTVMRDRPSVCPICRS